MTTSPRRSTVLVRITDRDAESACSVVSSAAQLFEAGDPVDVVLHVAGSAVAVESDAELVQSWVLAAVDAPERLPEIRLVGEDELADCEYVLDVEAGGPPWQAARSIALLTGVALSLTSPPAPPADRGLDARPSAVRAAVVLARAQRDLAVAAARGFDRRPHLAVVFQHRGYWASVERLYEALRERDDIDVTVVALDSDADSFARGTQEFLHERGWASQPADWFRAHVDEVDAVLLDNPYDEFRPESLHVPRLALLGLRMINVPYGNGAIGGELMDELLWDMPLHHHAWRNYLPDPSQQAMHARHCTGGSAAVRVLGSPKQDGTLAHRPGPLAGRIRRAAAGRRVVLWNPHFRVEPGGWSTYLELALPLLDEIAAREDVFLVVRPHFRLFETVANVRPDFGGLEVRLRDLSQKGTRVHLDESADYRDAFSAADALVSDLSSLASEFLLTGRPLLYTHRASGPGPNEAGRYFDSMDRAETWPDVRDFLDRLVAGDDPGREGRLAAVREHFPLADGRASERIAEDLATSLTEELHLRGRSVAALPELRPAAGLAPRPV